MSEEIKENKEEQLSPIEAAKLAAATLKAENDRREELLRKEEALHAEKLLSGHAEAGIIAEPPKEETPAEYAKRICSGDLKDDEGKI